MHGFTLPEVIAVLVIIGVLAAIAGPRFLRTGFDEARFAQESTSALRYAQSAALAMQRTVCVTATATSLTLQYVGTYGVTNCADPSVTGLMPPGGGAAPYQVTASGSVVFTAGAPASFSFDRAGRPSAAQALTVTGGAQIFVEAESGYVHN